ncbi:MAG: flagellar hook-length control protein FliK [Sulfuricella sp.]|nr:flagellar hook-length control protein FliK [Sulfuricella sp.]
MPQLPVSPVVSQPSGAGVGQSSASSASGSDGGTGLDGAQGQNFGEVLTKQMKEASKATASEGGETAGKPDASAVFPVDFSMLIASSPAPVAAIQAEGSDAVIADETTVTPTVIAAETAIMPVVTTDETAVTLAKAAVMPTAVPAESGLNKSLARSSRTVEDGGDEPAEESSAPAALPVDLSVLATPSFVPVIPTRIESDVKKAPVEATSDKILTQYSRTDEIGQAAKIAGDGKDLPAAMPPEKAFSAKLAAMVDTSVDKVSTQPQLADSPTFAQISATGSGAVEPLRQMEQQSSTLSVAPRVGSAEWGGAVGEKVLWMANQSHQVAELHLNPPNLGPLEVRLTINNDQASAMFVSSHAAVRESIEAALPRLREMLADNGITLGNTTVGSESFSQQQQAFDQQRRDGGEGARVDKGMEGILARISGAGRSTGLAHDGMVDIFA